MTTERVLIMGAAGRDFHSFNRSNPPASPVTRSAGRSRRRRSGSGAADGGRPPEFRRPGCRPRAPVATARARGARVPAGRRGAVWGDVRTGGVWGGIGEVTRRRLGRGGRILVRLGQRQLQLRNARRLRGQLRCLLSNQGARFGNDFRFSVHCATLAK